VNRIELSVTPRTVLGKKVRAMRRQGITPANVFGHRLESQAVQIETPTLMQTLRSLERNAVLSLKVQGEKVARPVIIRDIKREPTTDRIQHVDFFQVSLVEKMRADVPILLTGKAPAVFDLSGILLQPLDAISVEALPTDIPPHIEIDISTLVDFDTSLHVRDLVFGDNIHVLTDPDSVVASVSPPRVIAEAAAVEAPEGEEVAGEAAAE